MTGPGAQGRSTDMGRAAMELSVRREDRPGRPAPARERRPAGTGRDRVPWERAGGLAAGMLRLGLRRRGAVATLTLVAAALAAISTNALTRQAGRHPAPLFGTPERTPGRTAEAPRVRPAPPPAAAPTATATAPPAIRSSTPAVAPAPAPAPALAAPATPAKRDPIGDLIRGDTTTTASLRAEGDVRLAQRVLDKLGYGPLRADGVMGAGTRAAITRFEHDRKLPPTGEASGRTLRSLTLLSGGDAGAKTP